jgi:hypothetical protein
MENIMSAVWTKVVEDLMNYKPVEKTDANDTEK